MIGIDTERRVTIMPASRDDLLRMRLASQLLTPHGSSRTIAGVARHMLAVQGQDPVAALWALGVRLPGAVVGEVRESQRRGDVVRSWPMRGTIHLVPAEDIGWMQQLLNPRVLNDAVRRREMLDLPLETLERMRQIALDRLAGGGQLTRAELIECFTENGIVMRTGWSYHAVWCLCQTGTLVFGPPVGTREAALVLADEWIARPRRLEGDDALAELAARYLAGHGPATPRRPRLVDEASARSGAEGVRPGGRTRPRADLRRRRRAVVGGAGGTGCGARGAGGAPPARVRRIAAGLP
jgi:hypothetical protein